MDAYGGKWPLNQWPLSEQIYDENVICGEDYADGSVADSLAMASCFLAAFPAEPMLGCCIMLIVHVQVRVKPECVQAFRQATIENARQSVRESGIARFDVVQQNDDPTRFVLVEVYRTDDAPAKHKETHHYAAWRDAVAPMMAEPRSSRKFSNVFPEDAEWRGQSF